MTCSTLADWVGKSTALPEPRPDAIGRHVLGGAAIFADDTPIKLQGAGQRARPGRRGSGAYLWTAPLCKAFGDLRRTFGAATTSCSAPVSLDEIRGTAPKVCWRARGPINRSNGICQFRSDRLAIKTPSRSQNSCRLLRFRPWIERVRLSPSLPKQFAPSCWPMRLSRG